MCNNSRPSSSATALAVLSLILACSMPTLADDDADADPMGSRDKLVRTLLFESSAARKVELSGNEAAMAKRAEAIKIFRGRIQTRVCGTSRGAIQSGGRAAL